MSHLHRTKLFRDVSSLSARFAAATDPCRPAHSWTPAAKVVAGVLSRLAAMIAAWGTPAGDGLARRATLAFAPVPLNPEHLAAIAARFIPRDRAAELANNIAAALADGIEPVRATIQDLIQHRRAKHGLALSNADAADLLAALVAACSTDIGAGAAEDIAALGAAIGAIGRATADAALIQQRMRDAASIRA